MESLKHRAHRNTEHRLVTARDWGRSGDWGWEGGTAEGDQKAQTFSYKIKKF